LIGYGFDTDHPHDLGEGFAVGFDVIGSPQYTGVGEASLKETRFGILSVIVAHLPIEQRWREPNRLTID
jgi:hypothetical protein